MSRDVLLLGADPQIVPPGDRERIQELAGHRFEVLITEDRDRIEHLAPRIRVAARHVPRDIVTRYRNIEWFQQWYAGAEWTRDIPESRANELIITNTSGIHAAGMAEQILGGVFLFTRRLRRACHAQTQRDWNPGTMAEYSELEGKRVVVAGYGAVGRRVGALFRCLGSEVIGVRRRPLHADSSELEGHKVESQESEDQKSEDHRLSGDQSGEHKLGDEASGDHRLRDRTSATEASGSGARASGYVVGMEELFDVAADADVFISVLPLTPETEDLFDARFFEVLPQRAIFVNFGRGTQVDERELADALSREAISGAVLDVTRREPLPADDPLWSVPNLVITPHTGGFSDRYWERAFAVFLANLRRYLQGEQLRNVVDFHQGY